MQLHLSTLMYSKEGDFFQEVTVMYFCTLILKWDNNLTSRKGGRDRRKIFEKNWVLNDNNVREPLDQTFFPKGFGDFDARTYGFATVQDISVIGGFQIMGF